MKSLLFWVAIFCSISVRGQLFNSKDLYSKIVLIADERESQVSNGTGFIISKDKKYYLIIAKHVIANMDMKTTNGYFSYGSKIAVSYKLIHLLFNPIRRAFDEKSDCVVFQLDPFDAQCLSVLKHVAMDASILETSRTNLSRSMELLIMGYPIYNYSNFHPITNKTKIASSLISIDMGVNTNPFLGYYLEKISMQGFSGAPIFSGVSDGSTNKPIKTSLIGTVTGNDYDGGYTIITPAYYVLDLISQLTAQQE